METGTRRLIRPPLNDLKDKMDKNRPPSSAAQKKPVPPDQTNAENFYYVKQMQSKTPMVFVLKGGEEIHGTIEWYDKTCLKVNREDGPNLLIYKSNIAYIYKAGE
ncbi:MAG: RNA chaperone Hfq [Acidobacteria bacterium]|nr:RNA chaperone Hfq [Acidobacteriota bacterium]